MTSHSLLQSSSRFNQAFLTGPRDCVVVYPIELFVQLIHLFFLFLRYSEPVVHFVYNTKPISEKK